jgi:hypothetical protein
MHKLKNLPSNIIFIIFMGLSISINKLQHCLNGNIVSFAKDVRRFRKILSRMIGLLQSHNLKKKEFIFGQDLNRYISKIKVSKYNSIRHLQFKFMSQVQLASKVKKPKLNGLYDYHVKNLYEECLDSMSELDSLSNTFTKIDSDNMTIITNFVDCRDDNIKNINIIYKNFSDNNCLAIFEVALNEGKLFRVTLLKSLKNRFCVINCENNKSAAVDLSEIISRVEKFDDKTDSSKLIKCSAGDIESDVCKWNESGSFNPLSPTSLNLMDVINFFENKEGLINCYKQCLIEFFRKTESYHRTFGEKDCEKDEVIKMIKHYRDQIKLYLSNEVKVLKRHNVSSAPFINKLVYKNISDLITNVYNKVNSKIQTGTCLQYINDFDELLINLNTFLDSSDHGSDDIRGNVNCVEKYRVMTDSDIMSEADSDYLINLKLTYENITFVHFLVTSEGNAPYYIIINDANKTALLKSDSNLKCSINFRNLIHTIKDAAPNNLNKLLSHDHYVKDSSRLDKSLKINFYGRNIIPSRLLTDLTDLGENNPGINSSSMLSINSDGSSSYNHENFLKPYRVLFNNFHDDIELEFSLPNVRLHVISNLKMINVCTLVDNDYRYVESETGSYNNFKDFDSHRKYGVFKVNKVQSTGRLLGIEAKDLPFIEKVISEEAYNNEFPEYKASILNKLHHLIIKSNNTDFLKRVINKLSENYRRIRGEISDEAFEEHITKAKSLSVLKLKIDGWIKARKKKESLISKAPFGVKSESDSVENYFLTNVFTKKVFVKLDNMTEQEKLDYLNRVFFLIELNQTDFMALAMFSYHFMMNDKSEKTKQVFSRQYIQKLSTSKPGVKICYMNLGNDLYNAVTISQDVFKAFINLNSQSQHWVNDWLDHFLGPMPDTIEFKCFKVISKFGQPFDVFINKINCIEGGEIISIIDR